jgi:hypothetical protein
MVHRTLTSVPEMDAEQRLRDKLRKIETPKSRKGKSPA